MAISGAAATIRAMPTVGARATNTPTISDGVTPAFSAMARCQTYDAGAASMDTSAASFTSDHVRASRPDCSTFASCMSRRSSIRLSLAARARRICRTSFTPRAIGASWVHFPLSGQTEPAAYEGNAASARGRATARFIIASAKGSPVVVSSFARPHGRV